MNELTKWMNEVCFTVAVLNLNEFLTNKIISKSYKPLHPTNVVSRLFKYARKKKYSKLHMTTRALIFYQWYWKWICFGIFSKRERDVPNEILMGWNKVSRCHIKTTTATFCRRNNAFFNTRRQLSPAHVN